MKIKIWFTDYYRGFKIENDWLYIFISSHFDVELSDEPEFLFYGTSGKNHLNYNCYRVFYTFENKRPNFLACHFSICFDFLNKKNHYRLPYYGTLTGFETELLLQMPHFTKENYPKKDKFCCFLASNENAPERIRFFEKLSNYKRIDSGGLVNNNIGYQVVDKQDFIKDYKFIIAFENSSYPGYVTEKLIHPMFTNTIPIYWGSNKVHLDFNTKSFINFHEFSNDEEVINRIIKIDNDTEEYIKILNQPWFTGNQINEYINRENLLNFLKLMFSTKKTPIGLTWKKHANFLKIKSRNALIKFRKFMHPQS